MQNTFGTRLAIVAVIALVLALIFLPADLRIIGAHILGYFAPALGVAILVGFLFWKLKVFTVTFAILALLTMAFSYFDGDPMPKVYSLMVGGTALWLLSLIPVRLLANRRRKAVEGSTPPTTPR